MNIDVSAIIERQKLSRFLVSLIVVSWLITFFDGFDTNLISFAAPYLASEYHLDRIQLGNTFSIGLVGTLIGGLLLGYVGDRIGRRPSVILATAGFGILTMCFALANGYRPLFLLRFIDGIPLGGMLPLAWALNIEYAPKRYRATAVMVIYDRLFAGHRAGWSHCHLDDSEIWLEGGFPFRRRLVVTQRVHPFGHATGIDPLSRQQAAAARPHSGNCWAHRSRRAGRGGYDFRRR